MSATRFLSASTSPSACEALSLSLRFSTCRPEVMMPDTVPMPTRMMTNSKKPKCISRFLARFVAQAFDIGGEAAIIVGDQFFEHLNALAQLGDFLLGLGQDRLDAPG